MKAVLRRMFMLLPLTFVWIPAIYFIFLKYKVIPGIIAAEYFVYTGVLFAAVALNFINNKLLGKKITDYWIGKGKKFLILIWPYLVGLILAILLSGSLSKFEVIAKLKPDQTDYYQTMLFLTSMAVFVMGMRFSSMIEEKLIGGLQILLYANFVLYTVVIFMINDVPRNFPTVPGVFTVFFVLFLISLILVRNIKKTGDKIGIYKNSNTYNATGMLYRWKYYVYTIFFVAVVPISVGLIVAPAIISLLNHTVAAAIISFFMMLLGLSNLPIKQLPEGGGGEGALSVIKLPSLNLEFLLYSIILIGIFILIINPNIIMDILRAIYDFLQRFGLISRNGNIKQQNSLYNETTSKIERDKKRVKYVSIKSYGQFVTHVGKIATPSGRFTYSYNFLYWYLLDKNHSLEKGTTPSELSAYIQEQYKDMYTGFSSMSELYSQIKYRNREVETEEINDGILKISELIKTNVFA